jgi:hypothetical protein
VAVQSIFPQIAAAVQMVAEEAAFRWKGAVMKARLWSGEKVPYVESIKWTMTGPTRPRSPPITGWPGRSRPGARRAT